MNKIASLVLVAGTLLSVHQVSAQKKDSTRVIATAKVDTTKGPSRPGMPQPGTLKPYKDVITDKAVTDDGIFKVHKIDDKYYFELNNKSFNKDFLNVVRLSKAGAGMRSGMSGYAGDQIGENVVRFEKGPKNKVYMRTVSFADYSKPGSPMYTAVSRNNMQPVAMAFDVQTYGKDSSCVIDITSWINSDNEYVSFEGRSKSSFGVGGFQADKSFVNYVKSFPANIEINTTKTFTKGGGGGMQMQMGGGAPSGNVTTEINSSFVLLPENPMQPRYFDPRVGYFAVGYVDFDKNEQGTDKSILIKRWRLEPKPQDLEKYKKGQLVEPAKPIVFYIDPATPKKWVPYLIQGVNDWQKSFEKAGFKNAVYARVAPTPQEDPEWSLEDARYSAIVYKPSDVANASGPSIADPRTGEIMESHINWYHDVMKLLKNWYTVQAGPLDPRARKVEFDDELMGQLIRFVSSHEVGHTLGLRHNFISSATVPVEKLRDKNYLKKNGHTPSIMDYARFNYVAQPEDKIPADLLMPRIGDYDDWAIEWGYKRFYQFKDADAEKTFLNKWVMDAIKNPRLWFGTEMSANDPRLQNEIVGDNAMEANTYGIKNLQRIVPNLIEWTKEPNSDFTALKEMYSQVLGQYSRYLGHVAKYIGGIYETPKYQEESGPIYQAVEPELQKQALAFFNTQLFNTPTWLINKDIYGKLGLNAKSVIGSMQNSVLPRILNSSTLVKLMNAELSDEKAYPAATYLNDVKGYVMSDLLSGKAVDAFRRNLQNSYVNTLVNIISPAAAAAPSGGATVSARTQSSGSDNDVTALVRGHLTKLLTELEAKKNNADEMTSYHIAELINSLNKALDNKK
ncbi:MAG: DUF5117 domain-containing protein [Bacteroidia bacterium]|nr:MAG: DUF5117 domain-containing protein [Bacteroidia bacterium]